MRHLGTINCEGARQTNYSNINTAAPSSQRYQPPTQCNPVAQLCRTGIGNRDALVIQPPSVLTCAVPSDASGGLA
jgi:hypothetical protein